MDFHIQSFIGCFFSVFLPSETSGDVNFGEACYPPGHHPGGVDNHGSMQNSHQIPISHILHLFAGPPPGSPGRCGGPWIPVSRTSNHLLIFFSFFLALGHIRGCDFWRNVLPPPGTNREVWRAMGAHKSTLLSPFCTFFHFSRDPPPGSPGRCGGPWISHFLLIQPFVDFFSSFSFPRSHSRM